MKESKQRAYGIDIARLTAMFMVVLLHNLGQGGILDWTLDSARDLTYLGIENYAIVAVNVFALISGYLSAGKPLKARSIFSIWATACFWSTATGLTGFSLGQFSITDLLKSAFPVSTAEYWYLNSFLLLQLMVPFLNCAITSLTSVQLGIASSGLLIASTLFESTGLNEGYSTMWLAVLWLTGASIKRNKETLDRVVSTKRLLFVYVLLPLVVLYHQWNDVHVLQVSPGRWLSYSNPYVATSAICFFILTSRINVSSEKLKQLLRQVSPLAFAVYTIDNSRWFYRIWLSGRFSWLLDKPTLIGVPLLISISLIFFTVCLVLESLRKKAIKMLNSLKPDKSSNCRPAY